MEWCSLSGRWICEPARRRPRGTPPFGVLALLLLAWPTPPGFVHGQELQPRPVVHAILFYSPTCPHCHQVITEDLIPLQEQYGNRLVLLGFDTSQSWANDLFWEAIQHFEVPEDRWAVPFLVVGDQALIGGLEIPARFPSLIEAGLASDGIDFPEIPSIVSFLQEQGVLDPRYPDRRVAVQSPPEEEPAVEADSAVAGVETEAVLPADSSVADSAQVTALPGDSLEGEGAVEQEDTTQGGAREPDSVSIPAAAEPVDSGPRGEVAPPRPVTEETPPPTEAPARAEADTVTEARPATQEGGERPRPGDSASTPVSRIVTPGQEEQAPSPAGPATMDLETAARELGAMSMLDRFQLDPVGNSFSVVILVLMVGILFLWGYPPRARGGTWPEWIIPVLLIVGAAVAAYLSYVEVTGTRAVCGPVGDCNTVQQSPHARLFGILPVGLLGLMGYTAMFILWIIARSGPEGVGGKARLLLWAAALFGTLFSVYLTFLEPFVIGATCAWCLTSAVVMTLLLMATAPLAAGVWPTSPQTSS